MSLQYKRLDKPTQVPLGAINGVPVYASCANCGQENAIIHGAGLDPNTQKVALLTTGGFYKAAVYCESCTDKLMVMED